MHIHKKGDKRNCSSCSVLGKILARMSKIRTSNKIKISVKDTQYRFRDGRKNSRPITPDKISQ